MTQQQFKNSPDEEQFQSAMKALVVTTWVLYLAGYFLGLSKCSLIPERYMTYLGIDCVSRTRRFLVPEKRIEKYLPTLNSLLQKTSVSYSEVESMVGKLGSLECAVPAGMWYTRHQYAAMQLSGLKPDARKKVEQCYYDLCNT